MASKNFLDNVTIPSPCSADWNSMVGSDQVRFCEHCSLDVHNLSSMTRNQAQRLVSRSNGHLCVRYQSDTAGRPQTLPMRQKLHRINRRVSQIAAGAFSAALSVSSAVAQQSSSRTPGDLDPAGVTQVRTRWNPGTTIVGTVTDEHGAVITGATVFVSNSEAHLALYASTGFDGQYRIEGLEAGVYKLRIEAPGFAPDQSESYVQSREVRVDRMLSVAKIEENVEIESPDEVQTFSGVGGVVAFVLPEHPFVKAAQEDNLEELTALIAGIDVNLRDKRSGTTALEHAVRNANREMVQLLLSKGAKVNAQNAQGESAVMMLDEDATSDLVWDLLNAGADLKLKDESGNTALIHIADSKNLEALKILLDADADVNAKNESGQTALMRAAAEGLVNNVRALVLAGANLDAVDKYDMSALAQAFDNDHAAVVRFLKSKGACETVAQVQKEE